MSTVCNRAQAVSRSLAVIGLGRQVSWLLTRSSQYEGQAQRSPRLFCRPLKKPSQQCGNAGLINHSTSSFTNQTCFERFSSPDLPAEGFCSLRARHN